MALQKQNAVVPFIGGIQTKQNEFLVQPPNLLELDNGVFVAEGKIEKRKGFTKLNNKDFTGNAVAGKKLLNYNNDLLQLSQTSLYSYAESADIWFNKGAFASVTATKNSVIRNRASQTNQVNATNNNITVVVWEDSRGSNLYKYSIIDESSQTVIKSDMVLSNTGTCNWAVCSKFLTSFLVVLYSEGAVLKARIIDTLTFNEYVQTIVGVSTGNQPAASVVENGTNLVFAYNNSSNIIEVSSLYLDSSTTTPSLLKAGNGGQLTGLATACHLFTNKDSNQVFLIYSTSTSIQLQGMFTTLIINPAHNVLVTTTAATFPRVSGTDVGNSNEILLIWEESAASAKNHKLYSAHYTYNSNAVPVQTVAPAIIKRSVGLAGNCVRIGTSLYILAAHESPLQATNFLLQYKTQTDVPIAGKFLTSISGGQPVSGILPSFQTDAQGRYLISLLEITKLETNTGTIADNTGVVKIKLDFTNPPFVAAQLGESLLIAGGFVSAYDGNSVVEHGFHLFPEDVTIGHTNSGGSVGAGTYNCRVIYEWADGKGQIHRSSPSITTTTSPALTGNANILNVTVPTLRLSSKQDVSIVVYLTEANGTLFYRAATAANNPSQDTQTINISSITGLNTQEILYTTGGVVENIAPPAASIVHRHKNRIFLAGLESSNEIRYSQESVVNEGLAFSDFYRILVNPSGGPITALGTLDDKLIIFKQDRIYALSGNGPVFTGQSNDYTQPEEISTDTGCDNPASIVITPKGLMFSSEKGIRLLNRSLQIEDIGAPVEKYENYQVSSAVLLSNNDEVRFTTSAGPALVYNYAFNLWTAFTNYSALSSVNWDSSYLHLDSDGIVQRESSSYSDNGKAVPLHLKTSWIALAGLQGYKRIYRILMLGQKLSEHAFRVNIRYDYDDNIRETIYFNTTTQMSQEIVPQNTQWVGVDSNPISGVKSEVFQFDMRPRIQKCEAIQLEIEDIPLQGKIGAGFTLAGMTFLLGVLGDTAQVPNVIGSR